MIDTKSSGRPGVGRRVAWAAVAAAALVGAVGFGTASGFRPPAAAAAEPREPDEPQQERLGGSGRAVRPDVPSHLPLDPKGDALANAGGGTKRFRGIALAVHFPDRMDDYLRSVDEIAAVGADTVELVVTARQENGSSARIEVDERYAPSEAQLAALVRRAKDKGLRVVLMPVVLLRNPRGTEWRGTINPDSWADWFESYKRLIVGYAEFSRLRKVDVLVVGTELVSSEQRAADWSAVIRAVRERYDGLLTYESNWDHFEAVPFWDRLDFVAMNAYWKLGEDRRATDGDFDESWDAIKRTVLKFCRAKGKKLFFTEVGWCSLPNAPYEAYDYTRTELPADPVIQRRLYEAFTRAWGDEPDLAGHAVWEWGVDRAVDVTEDKSFRPNGKPAEAALRKLLAAGRKVPARRPADDR